VREVMRDWQQRWQGGHGVPGRTKARNISFTPAKSQADVETWKHDVPVPCGEERVGKDKETQCQLDLSMMDRARSVTKGGSSEGGERGA
jgi:hypothetical protein